VLLGIVLVIVAAPVRAQEDPFAAVAPLVRAHDDEAALARLEALPEDARQSAAGQYLRGRLLERLGRLSEAADAFATIGGLPQPVFVDSRWRRARLLARAGRCEDALPALDAVRSPPRRAQAAPALAAECAWRIAGDREEREAAVARLEAVVAENGARVDTFAIRMLLAEALTAVGRSDDAREQLLHLYVRRASHPDHDEVVRRLQRGGPIRLESEDTLTRAEHLLRARRVAEAAALLEGTPPRDRTLRRRWLHVRGMALYRTRHDYAEAARVLAEAATLGGPTAIDDEFHAARALSRADQDDEAIRAYRRLVRAHPRSDRASQAELLAAWLELYLGRSRGEAAMEAFVDGPRGSMNAGRRRRAVWSLAMAAYDAGRPRDAERLFLSYAGRGRSPMVRGRGVYWAGRAIERGDREGALRHYRLARSLDPLHWYGLLAAQRMEGLGVTEPVPLARPDPDPEPLPAVTLPASVRFYARLGLRRDALSALRRNERSLRAAAPQGRVSELLARAYGDLDGANRVTRLGRAQHRLLAQRPTGAARWAWEASYPKPHQQEVERAAQRAGVPWSHVYATMRQESGYDPDAVSHADALGLLQVLPSSGARVARRLGVDFRRDRLFDPAWNIRIGTEEIASSARPFDGCLPLATAAYNAGVARVRRWLRERPDMDLDLFVEKIPFDETRGYVRRVTSHRARYEYLEDPTRVIRIPSRVTAAGCE